jgi:hypothetical protein
MKKCLTIFVLFTAANTCISCHTAGPGTSSTDAPEVVTPVTVAAINNGPMEEYAELNATSVFQQKWIVRSNLTGYLQNSNLQLNKMVTKGQVLFTLKTKEAQSIGNTINTLDSSFRFSGVNVVRSNGTGFISEISHLPGDYVQDAEQLAVITDTRSFVFLLDLPYEMRSSIIGKASVPLLLPDGEQLQAVVSGSLPAMDSSSQTQRIILKVNASHPIPENLIGKVRLVRTQAGNAYYLPKSAVLADETQSDFWVMKMISDSTAAKVSIQKGIESGGNVQVIAPVFSARDKILVTGNFGLPDTAKVRIITPAQGDK